MLILKWMLCFCLGTYISPVLAHTFAPHTQYEVCFSPNKGCDKRLLRLIYQAKHSVYMQAYSFTLRSLGIALRKAKQRGLDVKVIVDRGQLLPQAHSQIAYLLKQHVPVWQDNVDNLAHNKVLIVDRRIVETGSFNYTYSAVRYNAENMLIIYSKLLAQHYLRNFQARLRHAVAVKEDAVIDAADK